MASAYRAEIVNQAEGVTTVRLAFGDPAGNESVVRDAIAAIAALKLQGGRGIKLTGPCSIPAAIAIGHAVSHLFGFVAFFDPKIERYVVCVVHGPGYRPGDLVD